MEIMYFGKISILNGGFACLMSKTSKLNYPENSAVQKDFPIAMAGNDFIPSDLTIAYINPY